MKAYKLLAYLIVLSIVFVWPYFMEGWWKFFIASLAIILWSAWMFPQKWRQKLGVHAKHQTIFISIAIFIVLFFLFNLLIDHQLFYAKISAQKIYYFWFLAIIFQVLNEEMVLRALLLQYFQQAFSSSLLCAIIVGMLFALLHAAFYYFTQHFLLSLSSILVLFLFGFTCNLLYLRFQHIWFGYAIHLAWNLNRFTASYTYHHQLLPEALSFNLIEGSGMMVFALGILALVTTLLIYRKKDRQC